MLLTLISYVYGQSTTNTIRMCSRSCKDGSAIVKCIDTGGASQSGDCYSATIGLYPLNCNSATGGNGGEVFDLHKYGGGPKFNSISDCEAISKPLKNNPNIPSISNKKYVDVLNSMLYRYDDFNSYSIQEKNKIRTLVSQKLNKRFISSFNESTSDDMVRELHGFAIKVRALSTTDTRGIYTNSKCAGCAILIESIIDKVSDTTCDVISDTIESTLCATTGPFMMFCSAISDKSGATDFISSLCLTALNEVSTFTSIDDRAKSLCSRLTCNVQSATIKSEYDITGTCTVKTNIREGSSELVAFNERCTQFLNIVELAERGICIADSIKVIKDTFSDPIEAGLDIIGSLAIGEISNVEESIQNLAEGCSNENYSTRISPLSYIIIFILSVILSI